MVDVADLVEPTEDFDLVDIAANLTFFLYSKSLFSLESN